MCFAVSQNLQTVKYLKENPTISVMKFLDGPDISKIGDNHFVSAFEFPLLPVVTEDSIVLMCWGLIPFWTKGVEEMKKIRTMTLNARGETLYEKPSFRESVKQRRCLLPVNGFFEWRDVNKQKYPYYIFPKKSSVFYLGCIYDQWTDRETGEIVESFGMITTVANQMMSEIHNSGANHNRMPLIIEESRTKEWLDSSIDRKRVQNLIAPYHDDKMDAFTISKEANYSRKNRNYPDILKPVAYPEIESGHGMFFSE